jgi:hypothetical protein
MSHSKSQLIIKLFVLFCLMMLSPTVKSQVLGTTMEEYNYLTKGYKVQVESGLDMKKGYELSPLTTYQYNFSDLFGEYNYTFDFQELTLTSTAEQRAILLIIKKSGKILHYVAIPNKNSDRELWNTYIAALKVILNASADAYHMPTAFAYATSRLSVN